MDSLLFLCARLIISQRPLPTLPAHLYPVLFQVAFLDRKRWVLQDLVATWPFPVLHFQQLVGCPELLQDDLCKLCVLAVIQAVVAQLQQVLQEPGRDSSGCRLRVLDMTGVPGDPDGFHVWSSTGVLAKACLEVSKHQPEFQRHRPRRHEGSSGAATATAAPQPLGIDIYTDLHVKRSSYRILLNALQAGGAGLLHLKCREFKAERISASEIVTLLESLDPSCLRRVDLRFLNLGLKGLLVILQHLSRFPELRSLKIQHSNMDMRHLTLKTDKIHCVAKQLGMLPKLRELNLECSQLPGNLRQILSDLQAPLESLELASCCLISDDLTFLSQSFHAPALKKLDLSGLDLSQGLLEPLRLLLEETSASLLYLNLNYCDMADSHLHALLPTLLRCSRLRFLGLHGNPLSTAVVKDLLQKTLELPDLHQVVYPFPVDGPRPQQPDSIWNFALELQHEEAVKAEFSLMLANSGRTDLIWICSAFDHSDLDYFSL